MHVHAVANPFTRMAEISLTHGHDICGQMSLGHNVAFDAKAMKLAKNSHAINWSPAEKTWIIVKHDSVEDVMKPGKFTVQSGHKNIGAEWSFDWASKAMTARLGMTHKHSDEWSSKAKVDQKGHLDVASKWKVSAQLTANVRSSVELKDLASGKTSAAPVGFAFDLKL